jgi:hypothetical protein
VLKIEKELSSERIQIRLQERIKNKHYKHMASNEGLALNVY